MFRCRCPGGGGDTLGNPWSRCAVRFFKSWPSSTSSDKKSNFPQPFSHQTSKSIPIFRPDLRQKLCYLYLAGRKQKFLQIPFEFACFFFLSNPFFTMNTFKYSRSSLENHTRFQTKMGKVPPFSVQNGAKNLPDGAAHTYIAYIREYPHGGRRVVGPCFGVRSHFSFVRPKSWLSFWKGVSVTHIAFLFIKKTCTGSRTETSFPGFSPTRPTERERERDPGKRWSRVSQNLGDYKQTIWGRGR